MQTKQTKNLIEENLIIAKFMNIKPKLIAPDTYSLSNTPYWNITEDTPEKTLEKASLLLGYHEDWNKLIEVIHKILIISLENDSMELYYNITDSIPFIEPTHQAVIEFINFYNVNDLKNEKYKN